jgi:hypothetical protein
VEGQASWLTLEYAARQAGKTMTDAATAHEFLRQELDPDDPQYPVFSKAPLYLRATMLFPYQEGETFQQAVVLQKGQSAFGLLFTKPPVSTSQVLHPDRYFAGTAPTVPVLPKPAQGMKAAVEGVFGEEDMHVLLRQYTAMSLAEGLAPGMTGGVYRIDEEKKAEKDKKEHHTSLLFATEWDSEDSAVSFLNAYQTVLEKKWKHLDKGDENTTHISGKSEDGYYRVERKGKIVISLEGFSNKL